MLRLILALIFSTLGGTLLLHRLKNFSLKEKLKPRLNWDALIERLIITAIIIQAPNLWPLILLTILAKVLYRIFLLGFIPGILKSQEPGTAAQKVLLKAELAFDLILSPTFAILTGVLAK